MGICWPKPAKCAHASSTNFSGSAKTHSNTKPESTSSTQKSPKETSNKPFISSKSHSPVSSSLKSFTFSDLKNATKNFRSETYLGEGGFGCVFKGWIDANTFVPAKPGTGIVVAIKKLKAESFQGHKEWLAEVNYLGQLHHENLVKLIGYCVESENRLLVYEFMQKGSLENHLFKKGVQPISWATRMHIARGVARGLTFLHSLDANVIYRDLKASNILLDSDYNAKLSDFGLARDGPTGDNTHVSTRVVGTQGYAAPEYVATDLQRVISRTAVPNPTKKNEEWEQHRGIILIYYILLGILKLNSLALLIVNELRLSNKVSKQILATVKPAQFLPHLLSLFIPWDLLADSENNNSIPSCYVCLTLLPPLYRLRAIEHNMLSMIIPTTTLMKTARKFLCGFLSHLTPKSDLYSFGVVLLELLSGRRAMDGERVGFSEETLVEWAKPFLVDKRKVLRIMDSRLGGQYSKKGAQAAAALALQCLHADPKNRPCMADVLASLERLHATKQASPRTPQQLHAKHDHHGIKHVNSPHKARISTANSL
ncbi:hypothetical protein V6N12_051662 [Hibiscus sabdariffa]|uniref:Protein kinase domain-containing protein n=1 Tax=Hibiscus sabdariffa TaxID=183260 RepID=A0ABR2GFY9_9ROSI